MDFPKDPLGAAINDFNHCQKTQNIIVKSDLCDDDVIPVAYLFRSYEMMPKIEQTAINMCEGSILDVGAGTGCHSLILKEKGMKVLSIDTSKGCVDHMNSKGLNAQHIGLLELTEPRFNTVLVLMNGLGLAGELENLDKFISHLKSLLLPNGKILCDSTDIKFMYENEDGSVWVDLNSAYYGEMKFNMQYNNIESGWFPWVYVGQDKLKECCDKLGLSLTILEEGENNHYLAEIK
jgi:SAM-dependent methyltransferase